ncbi:hypothetical protein NDU88_006119 [Pleurodeles waltl]|uniref:Uncharacterized protein n=1 Tax=Pleurodeles waltl TaxID=8319 RepID=A0AAV7SNP6_PLEWA|nr:hypothetical protein NDU88_006119 [Pleurodeles waltl]
MRPGDRGVSAAGPGVSIALSVHRWLPARRPPRLGVWGGCAAGDAPILVPLPPDKPRGTPPSRRSGPGHRAPTRGPAFLPRLSFPSGWNPGGTPLERRAASAHGPRHGQRPLSQPPVPRSPLSAIRRGLAAGGSPLTAPTPLGRISEDPVLQAVRTPQLRVSATRYVRGAAGGTRGFACGSG